MRFEDIRTGDMARRIVWNRNDGRCMYGRVVRGYTSASRYIDIEVDGVPMLLMYPEEFIIVEANR